MNCKYNKPLFATIALVIFTYFQIVFALDLAQAVESQTVRPGGRFPITNQTLIQDLSNFIVSNSSLEGVCSVQRVVNPQQQIVAGTLYYMTVQISRIKPGSGYTTAQCGTVDPSNLEVVCEEFKIFKPLLSDTYQIKNETRVTCPP